MNGLLASMKQKKNCTLVAFPKIFLKDEESDNESMEMSSFKPKVGRSTLIEDTPDYLPDFLRFM